MIYSHAQTKVRGRGERCRSHTSDCCCICSSKEGMQEEASRKTRNINAFEAIDFRLRLARSYKRPCACRLDPSTVLLPQRPSVSYRLKPALALTPPPAAPTCLLLLLLGRLQTPSDGVAKPTCTTPTPTAGSIPPEHRERDIYPSRMARTASTTRSFTCGRRSCGANSRGCGFRDGVSRSVASMAMYIVNRRRGKVGYLHGWPSAARFFHAFPRS